MMIKNLTKKELEILDKALEEYEENYYAGKDQKWQKIVNSLKDKIATELNRR